MKRVLLVCILILFSAPAMADPMDVAGRWLTQDKDAIIEIHDCGDGTPCGTLVWAAIKPGGPKTDRRNPDETLRDRPILGMTMIWGFSQDGQKWRSGKIYNAGNGKTYGSGLSIAVDGSLALKGCLGPFCKTQRWTRVPDHDDRGLLASSAH